MTRQHVLIVDDDQDFATSLADLVEEQGFDITCSTSGEEAVRLFDRESFDLTFMDVRMPVMNGVECLQEIRRKQPDAKVVMVTGFSADGLLQQAKDCGAMDVMHKPVILQHLFSVLNDIKSAGVILVVDDDDACAKSMQELLIQQGYEVHAVSCCSEALNAVLSIGVDLMILDLRLPVLSGYETYMELREAGHDLPVIVITAYPEDESEQLRKMTPFLKAGYLVKPARPEKLVQKVASILKTSQPMI